MSLSQKEILALLELFMDLDASDEQLDCPFLYASARDGYAVKDLKDEKKDMTALFETILEYIPAPEGDPKANTQVLISTIDYNEYVGRIGIGKVDNGCLKINQEAVVVNHHEPDARAKKWEWVGKERKGKHSFLQWSLTGYSSQTPGAGPMPRNV